MADWLQAAGNAQRTSFSTESMLTTWSQPWRYQFHVLHREKLYPPAQPIVVGTRVIMPTVRGKIRSILGGTGGSALQWTADVGAPIMGSLVSDGTNVYAFDVLGRVSAFKLADGTQSTGWTNPVQVATGPFQSSPLYSDGLLICGSGDGYLYAISPANGAPVWSFNAGAPILQSAAGSTGVVVVGVMDTTVLCVHTTGGSAGTQKWRTASLLAAGFQSFWPVIHQSKVVIRPWIKYPDPAESGILTSPIRGIPTSDALSDAAMTSALAAYDANPSAYMQALYVLDLVTGTVLPGVIHWAWRGTMHGATAAPCVDKDGYLIIPINKPPAVSGGESGWARLNLATRKIVDVLQSPGGAWATAGNRDENMFASACQTGVFATHMQERNAAATGYYSQVTGTWALFGSGTSSTLLYENTQGGGAGPTVISGGFTYHAAHPHTLVARTTV